MVRLSTVMAGAIAELQKSEVDPECRAWLRALGLTDTSRLRVCQDGSPFIIQVRSTRIGLSKSIAEALWVVVVRDGDQP